MTRRRTRRVPLTGAIPDTLDRQMHRTINKVGEDNPVSALQHRHRQADRAEQRDEQAPEYSAGAGGKLHLMLAPLAPHIAEEIWHRLGHERTLARRPWPTFDPAKLIETTMDLPVQVNGNVRDKVTVPADADEAAILQTAELAPGIQQWIDGKTSKSASTSRKMVNLVVG